MTCARYRDLISRYVDDEVTPRQRTELLTHVGHCHECAAWLARLRQADVLLKGVPETHPSDRVRQVVLNSALHPDDLKRAKTTQNRAHTTRLPQSGWRLYASELLLRVEMQPQRVALLVATALLSILGIAYWANSVRPFWGFDKFGFLYPVEQASVATPTPLTAISSGVNGVGGVVAAPNVVTSQPVEGAQDVSSSSPLRIRFDQPMDRLSVQSALRIDPPAAGQFAWNADNEVQFNPSDNGLLAGITYTLSLADSARSLAGTQISEPANWAFHTAPGYSVSVDTTAGSIVAPTQSFTLKFGGPMEAASTEHALSLRAAGEQADIPARLAWNASDTELAVSPIAPLQPGKVVTLRVGPAARTSNGQSLGQASSFEYTVALPVPRLRFLAGRVDIQQAAAPLKARFEALSPGDSALPGVVFDLYSLPGSKLSALGAQASMWPSTLPAGLTDDLLHLATLTTSTSTGANLPELRDQPLPQLQPGTYLVTASAPSSGGTLSDWQLLIVADRTLSLVDGNILWAKGEDGKAWPQAEISLYSPRASLLDKGVTQEAGVWASEHGSRATLAIARDLDGHLAALVLDSPLQAPRGNMVATLLTDAAQYHPGGRAQFRLLFGHDSGITQEQDVNISLLNPGGAVVSMLTLKPDAVGGVTGLFDLGPDVQPGQYTIRATAGTAQRDFPVQVEGRSADDLRVYTSPASEAEDGTTVTCMVSVLGGYGAEAAGALITATLRINGDNWVSDPVTSTLGANGRGTVTMSLPEWSARYNEPGLYVDVQADWQGNHGSGRAALDLSSLQHLRGGHIDMVSPSMGIAGIAQPEGDGSSRLRLVALDSAQTPGELLILATSRTGERTAWTLDLETAKSKGDATLTVPEQFTGGTVQISRVGLEGSRTLALPDVSDKLSLIVSASETATPGSEVPVTVNLRDAEGSGLEGTAALLWRRVSGLESENINDPLSWEPAAHLDVSGTASVNLAAPTSPGLWFLVCQVSTSEGMQLSSRTAVKVAGGPAIEVPPVVLAAGTETTLSISVHNPGQDRLSGNVQLSTDGPVSLATDNPQLVDVDSSEWQRLTWKLQPRQTGKYTIAVTLHSSGNSDATWSVPLVVESAVDRSTTYAAGALNGQQTVGVQVPSGMDNEVRLQVRASTSLLSALTDAVMQVKNGAENRDVYHWASLLCAESLVESAYRRASLDTPPGLIRSGVSYSLALQEIYALQHRDGGWSDSSDVDTPSSASETAAVLVAMRRLSLASTGAGIDPQPSIDSSVQSRALNFLANKAAEGLDSQPTTRQLNERARSFYALSLYGAVQPEEIRPLIAYLSDSSEAKLTQAGQAWLALALWQSGDTSDALAVLDRVLDGGAEDPDSASAVLEALAVMNTANRHSARPDGGVGTTGPSASQVPDWDLEGKYVQMLMSARRGAAWGTPNEADALWALSRYAAEENNRPSGRPDITLNDGALGVASVPDNPDTFVVELSGGPLHAGTNWLRLQSFDGQPIYYSLTLKAQK